MKTFLISEEEWRGLDFKVMLDIEAMHYCAHVKDPAKFGAVSESRPFDLFNMAKWEGRKMIEEMIGRKMNVSTFKVAA